METRSLGNGGALPTIAFADEDKLKGNGIGDKDSRLIWLIILIVNLTIVVVIPCASVMYRKLYGVEEPETMNGREDGNDNHNCETKPKREISREEYEQLFQSCGVSLCIEDELLSHRDKTAAEDVDLEKVSSLDYANDEDHPFGVLAFSKDNGCTSVAVPITCAICLESYKRNDIVTWSTNPQCQHLFHQNCIIDFYTTTKKRKNSSSSSYVQDTLCPCCRQQFCDTSQIEKQAMQNGPLENKTEQTNFENTNNNEH